MIVDELVSLIRFDMPATSKTALAGINKTISKITDSMKSLGIVSAVTSGIFAAFSVNAAKDATSLANLAQSTGVSVKEIEALGAVYEKMGGSAKNFASDADAFRKNFGGTLDLEKMISLSTQFQGLSKEAAFQLGRAYGFSDDMIRVLMKGPDELRRMGEEAKKNNTTNEKSLENLKALDSAWVDLKNVIGPVAKEVQGAFAPVLEGGLTWLAKLLEENKDSIRETMNAIGESVKSAFTLIGGYAKAGWDFAKPYLVGGWKMIDGAAKEAMDKLGTILKSGWDAATKIIIDAWAKIKPDIEKGWQFIKTSAAEAAPKIEEITTAIGGYYQSLFSEISKLDFGGLIKGIWDYFKPSDELIDTVKGSLSGIADAIAGFYSKIKEQIDGGALGRMWESMKSIATSPVVQALLEKLKSISETLSGMTWTGLETAFKLVNAIVEPTLKTIEGLLNVLDGVANFDMNKILVGIKGIAEAFAQALSDVFEKIIPDLLKKILSQLPVVGDYFKDNSGQEPATSQEKSTTRKIVDVLTGANALRSVADWWSGDKQDTQAHGEVQPDTKAPENKPVEIPKEMQVRLPTEPRQPQPSVDDLAMGEMMGAFDHVDGGMNRTNKVEYNQTTVSQFFFNLSSNLVETSKAQGALSYARSGNM